MPFTPELFSARALERLEEQGHHQLAAVPYFDGLLAGGVTAELIEAQLTAGSVEDVVLGKVGPELCLVLTGDRLIADADQIASERGVRDEAGPVGVWAGDAPLPAQTPRNPQETNGMFGVPRLVNGLQIGYFPVPRRRD